MLEKLNKHVDFGEPVDRTPSHETFSTLPSSVHTSHCGQGVARRVCIKHVRCGVWRSTRSMLIRVSFRQVLQLGCNPTPTLCDTLSTKLQVLDLGPLVQMFRSQISTVVTHTISSHLDVAIDHETLQP